MSTAPLPDPPARASRTDSAARVAKLYERHGRMVYGICRVMLRDPHDAEDATQQAFLSAYRALLGGAHVRDEGAWISTIARNECRARISAAMRAPLPISDEDITSIEAPADETERSMHVDALRSALAELPERQREAVVLRDLYGLRYGEVATALGLSRPATEALLFRARRAMRHRLRPAIATTLTVPIAVQDALAQGIPGFSTAGGGAVLAGAAGGGLLAKLTAGPVGVKVATAAVAVTTVGTVGAVESENGGRGRTPTPAVVATADSAAGEEDDSSGRGRGDDRGVEDDRSGPGGGGDDRVDDDRSGSGSGRSGRDEDSSSSSDDAKDADSSGPGPSSGDAPDDDSARAVTTERSSSSGPGSGSAPAADEPDSSGPGSGGSSGSDATSDSSSSGSDSDGSGSGSSGPRTTDSDDELDD